MFCKILVCFLRFLYAIFKFSAFNPLLGLLVLSLGAIGLLFFFLAAALSSFKAATTLFFPLPAVRLLVFFFLQLLNCLQQMDCPADNLYSNVAPHKSNNPKTCGGTRGVGVASGTTINIIGSYPVGSIAAGSSAFSLLGIAGFESLAVDLSSEMRCRVFEAEILCRLEEK
ncbi:hypothetical protein ACOSQ3_013272 [Xanthoceras sorbifolium]